MVTIIGANIHSPLFISYLLVVNYLKYLLYSPSNPLP